MDNTHEWCADGRRSTRALQGRPCPTFRASENILRGEAAIVERVRDLGPDRAVETEFEREGISRWSRALGADASSASSASTAFAEERRFDADGIALLRVAGESLANGLERRRYEDSLRNSEAHLRSIFRASPVGIGLVRDRVLLEINERVCEMTGYSREELVGKNARHLYPTQEEFEFVGREKYAQIRQPASARWRRAGGARTGASSTS